MGTFIVAFIDTDSGFHTCTHGAVGDGGEAGSDRNWLLVFCHRGDLDLRADL